MWGNCPPRTRRAFNTKIGRNTFNDTPMPEDL
jgi:hypothetical protein